MRRLQCRICNKWDDENDRDYGEVIKKDETIDVLPGLRGIEFPIIVYTVKCKKCSRTWRYRKKRK